MKETGPRSPRPLSRTASRRLVIVSIVVVLALSAFTAYVLVWSVQDPDLQQRLEEAREAVRADSAAVEADTTAPLPQP